MTPLRIAITGSTGLIGTALVAALRASGHEVLRIVRRAGEGPGTVVWNPTTGFPAGTKALEGLDALVHLAGEGIANKRWNEALKQEIRDSRLVGTRTLVSALQGLQLPPRVLLSGSAVGYYPATIGEAWLDEESLPDTNFLGSLAAEWEAEALKAAQGTSTRVVLLRTGMVLSPAGGALARMLPFFKSGLGGRLGSGCQYISWITLADAVAAITHCMATESLSGPANLVTPNPVTNADFTRTLARVLGRPVAPPVPAFALRLLYGELADAALLVSQRIQPSVLERTGFQYRHPDLEPALRHLLAK